MDYLLIFLGVMIFLFAVGVPVAISIGLTCLVVLVVQGGIEKIPEELFAMQMLSGLNNFPIIAVPFFILAASLMNTGSSNERIFNFATALVGPIRGGLGHVNVLASVIFAGMSATAVADVAGIGQLELKAMKERGYPQRFSVGITGAASIISPVIPPSVALVVYGWLSGTSIAALFMAGVIPGIILAIGLSTTVLLSSYWLDLPGTKRVPGGEVFRLFLHAIPPLTTPIIIIGGIWTGIFTPTEAGAVACMYAFFLGAVVYRDVTLSEFLEALRRTVRFTSVIMFIIAIATFYGWLLVRVRIPQELAMALLDLNLAETQAILLILLFFLVIGCFMSVVEAVLIFTPIFMLTVQSLGIDPVWFGVLMVMTLSVGVITPPFGNVLFVLTELTGMPFEKVVVAILPFLVPIVLTVLLLVFFPSLVTFLPEVMH
ncbi:TRAP transporter large permease [Roseovarius indicus]|uniref:TRAP transporter large permease protein n=1 Tax=Roseovarius indicus TaxID=540747 RepID=A0A0T5P5H1_9RHOB|nr:TRAP transporter large permease [Roseovarius indicus]KRS16110.1 C4-dicarboxylate ABC transporter permease [Roseovarius indicus]OAO09275.1 C4-dicarboxylate ABC transporter permease [Roseovarius indicus]QEW24942.1 Neu5Ac permease [Roseovarius indicus]SFE41693.1 TRAP transporter, DctM subunit [Roseovarius indicus]